MSALGVVMSFERLTHKVEPMNEFGLFGSKYACSYIGVRLTV